jgi:hypothetical protein
MDQKESARQYQDDLEQYKMENVVNAPKNYVYRVGYESSSGNATTPEHSVVKKTRDLND